MQVEVYTIAQNGNSISISLAAVCDSFSSLLWDVEYYQCGAFEIYIAATAQNLEIFQQGRLVGRDDETQHFGLIESVQIETDAENGDYLTVSGRFLPCLLERRIIRQTVTASGTYDFIVQNVIAQNAVDVGFRTIPGLTIGETSGACWQKKTRLQVSYENLMEWIYTICETVGGSFDIRISGSSFVCDFFEGADRSILQAENPPVIFSDVYSNLLSFTYASDSSVQKNFAYIFGSGEGSARKSTTYYTGQEPSYLDRYEVYVDAKSVTQEDGMTDEEYIEVLQESGAESIVPPQVASESTIAVLSTQYRYGADYHVGDYVTVEHTKFGFTQEKIQLVGMVESFDQNGRSLTPTFKI